MGPLLCGQLVLLRPPVKKRTTMRKIEVPFGFYIKKKEVEVELVGAGTNLVHPGGESVWSNTNESSAVTFDKIVINYYLVFAGLPPLAARMSNRRIGVGKKVRKVASGECKRT